ncbi:MAG: hypothetical protein ABFS18_12710 [Thermodesulfobacteriota bacterium]
MARVLAKPDKKDYGADGKAKNDADESGGSLVLRISGAGLRGTAFYRRHRSGKGGANIITQPVGKLIPDDQRLPPGFFPVDTFADKLFKVRQQLVESLPGLVHLLVAQVVDFHAGQEQRFRPFPCRAVGEVLLHLMGDGDEVVALALGRSLEIGLHIG